MWASREGNYAAPKGFSDAGCGDALFDIGANIGLTTYYARPFFETAYCFEPNPKVFSVLAANLYDFLGGAFILSPSKSYTVEELATKDGFSRFDERNYEKLTIQLRKGRDVLAELFAEGKRNVVMKVEGFEQSALKEIAAALPADARFAMVFENWSTSSDPKAFVAEFFSRHLQVYKLTTTTSDAVANKVRKFWDVLVHGQRCFLTDSPKNWTGTLILVAPAVEVR